MLKLRTFPTISVYQGYATTYPSYNTEQDCRNCHGNTVIRHHALITEKHIGCPDCHPYVNGELQVVRNCLQCHPSMTHDDCIKCHGTNYTNATPSVDRTFVNISAFNESIHQDINATPLATVNSQDCWTCHYYKDMNRLNIKKCGDCHRKPSQWHGNANITNNLSEIW